MREQIRDFLKHTLDKGQIAVGIDAYKWCQESPYTLASEAHSRKIEGLIYGLAEFSLFTTTIKYAWRDQFDREQQGLIDKHRDLWEFTKHGSRIGGGIIADTLVIVGAASLTPDPSPESLLAAKFVSNFLAHSAIGVGAGASRLLRAGISRAAEHVSTKYLHPNKGNLAS